jgi:ribosomal protein S12 methylthiotransferase accessory factor
LPLESVVSPYVGIVRGVQDVLVGPEDIRLVTAWCETAHPYVVNGGGSGVTAADARAAAIGEAIERYSACFVGDTVVASAREIGPSAVDPARFALYSERQYATPGFPYERFDRETRVAWVEGMSIPDGEPAWLPSQLVHLADADAGPRICRATSSGLACHTTKGAATLAALLEVLERDAFMIAWKARLSLPLLEWPSNENLAIFEHDRLRPTGLRWNAIDLGAFLNVPCVAAVVRSDVPGAAPFGVGAAAALDVEDAVTKALDEATRVRTWAQALRRIGRAAPSSIVDFDDHIAFYADPANAARVDFLDASPVRHDAAHVHAVRGIEEICAQLGRRGVTAYAVDVTSPDVRDAELSVVRVIAPELCGLDVEHDAQLLGGHRLYDEARRFGREGFTEDHVNPDPHPFP